MSLSQHVLDRIAAISAVLVFAIQVPDSARASHAVGWGDNRERQLSFATDLHYGTVAAGGFQSLLSQPDGSILGCASPSNTIVSPPTNSLPVVALAAGYNHGLALMSDGAVFAFGSNDHGQTNVPVGFTNFIAIGAGAYHSLGVLSDGTVVSWGDNYQNHRIVPAGLSNVVAVAGGYYHSLALRSNGTVVAWGLNGDRQTSVPAGLSNVVAIAAGSFHSLALRKNGTVVGWGRNDHGQCSVPRDLSNVIAIAAGYQHSIALKDDGSIIGWGDNSSGQASPPSLVKGIAIAAGYEHSIALRGRATWPAFQLMPVSIFTNRGATVSFSSLAAANGPILYQWQFNGQDLPGQTNETLQLANLQPTDAGVYTIIANGSGFFVSARALLVLDGPTILGQPASISVPAGEPASFLVTAVSSAPLSYQWQFNGANLAGATNDSLFLPSVFAADGGLYQAVITTSSGSVTSAPALLTVFSPPAILVDPTNTVAIVGSLAQFSVTATGSVPLTYQWFLNGSPILQATNSLLTLKASVPGQIYVVVSNAYGSANSSAARLDVTRDQSILVWGDNTYSESNPPPNLTGLSQLACGVFRVMALKTNGTLIGWGRNLFGESTVPGNLTNAAAVSISSHNLVLKSDGTVASWGFGSLGQTNVPRGLSNVVAVSAGTAFSLALKSDGTVAAWGDNSHNQTNVPPNVSNIVAIAAGEYHSVALKNDGTVVSWGQTNPPYHIPPAGLSNIVAIASGYTHSLALRADGTVVAWGQNDVGQLSIPPGLSNVIAISAGSFDGLALKSDGTVVPLGAYYSGLDFFPPALTNVALFSVGVAVGGVQFGSRPWPVFSQTPASQVASNGDTVTFSATVSAAYSLRYQWQFNGVNISGETNSILTLTNVQPANAGVYRVIVQAGGYVVSAIAQLALNTELFVLSTSGDQAVVNGKSAIVFVSAVANSPITYQWKLNGTLLNGQTDATITIASAGASDAGAYSAMLSAGTASMEVSAGRLTVKFPPVADPTPRNVTANAGDTVRLQPTVSGPGPFAYHWTGSGVTSTNATNAVLVLTNVLFGDRYVVTIQNGDGIATNVFVLTVLLPRNGLAEWDDFAPIIYPWPTNFVSISAGYQHVLAALADGTVRSYGLNDFGQMTIPGGLHNVVQVAPGFSHSLALRSDGTVVGWGDNFSGQITIPGAASELIAISAGKEYSLGLRADGTLVAWGDNTHGQTNVPSVSGVIAMSAGYHHALALLSNGKVVGWGENSFGQATPAGSLSDAVAISAGGLHSLALTRTGAIVAWGDNTYGQLNVPASATNVIAIAAGYAHSLALRSDGTVVRWGRGAFNLNSTFVPASIAHVSSIAAGYSECVVATAPN